MTLRCKKGFSLIEVLIALALLSYGLLAIASLAGTVIKATAFGKRQTQAVNLAAEKLEMLKAVSYGDLQATMNSAGINRTCVGAAPVFTCTPTPSTEIMDGSLPYSWSYTITYVDLDNDGVVVEASGVADARDIKRIDVNVGWTDLFGRHTTTLTILRKT